MQQNQPQNLMAAEPVPGLRSRARVQQGIRWGLGYTAGLMLLGCASRSRGCSRRWNVVWSHL